MINFYTHFDANYRAQAATMIDSLIRHASEPFNLYCLWLDQTGKTIGECGRFPFDLPEGGEMGIITLDLLMKIQGPKLAKAKENRPWREFCWTLEPAFIDAALRGPGAIDGTVAVYVDADSFFFADPIPAIKEAVYDASIALTPHYFPADMIDRVRTVGIYNFGFGVFKSNMATRGLVRSWLDKSLAVWGPGENDQTMLDEWPSIMGSQLVSMPRGFNVGPWQEIEAGYPFKCDELFGNDGKETFPIISYHFHEFRRGVGKNPISLGNEMWNRTNYDIHPSVIELIYKSYERELEKWL